jgi:transposase
MVTQKDRKVYSKVFKVISVRMVTEQGRSVSEVARNLGINEQMLNNWKKNLEENEDCTFPDKCSLNPHESEVRDLKQEIVKLMEERDILTLLIKGGSKNALLNLFQNP